MKDDAIVQLLWDRDEAALAQAKQEYEPYCLYIAQNLLRDGQDAKECLNDMWLAVWKSIPPLRCGAGLRCSEKRTKSGARPTSSHTVRVLLQPADT